MKEEVKKIWSKKVKETLKKEPELKENLLTVHTIASELGDTKEERKIHKEIVEELLEDLR